MSLFEKNIKILTIVQEIGLPIKDIMPYKRSETFYRESGLAVRQFVSCDNLTYAKRFLRVAFVQITLRKKIPNL